MTKKLSELLAELSDKAKQMETKVADAKSTTEGSIEKWADSVKSKAVANKQAFDQKKDSLKDDAKSYWEKVKMNFDNGVSKLKSDFKDAGQDLKSVDAALQAEWAEDNAEMSLYFALNAMSDAEESIIEAINARAKADSLK